MSSAGYRCSWSSRLDHYVLLRKALQVESRQERRVTLADVGRAAGVSPGTVSRAINGSGQLAAATKERVLVAAERLGFTPNALAQALLTGRSFTVGLLTTDSIGRFTIPLMLGVEDALSAGKIALLLCDARDDPIRESHYVNAMLARGVDGIIVTGRRCDPRPPLPDLPVPVVYAVAPSTNPADSSVTPDEAAGAKLAVRHLLATGRRHIAHITGPMHHWVSRVRADAAIEELTAAGTALTGDVLFGEWSESWGQQALALLLHSYPDTDAIFCGSDQIARGVADGLRDAGRVIPDEIAIVGFDNWDVMVAGCRPPLTTVDRNLRQVGRCTAERLLDAISGEHRPGTQRLPCHLVVRESTRIGPPRVLT
jgi:LacI family transcriptional regulator